LTGCPDDSLADIFDFSGALPYNAISGVTMKTVKIIAAVLLVLFGLWILALTAISGPFFTLFSNQMSDLIISISFGILLLAFGGILFFK